jgi:hypothetical protein
MFAMTFSAFSVTAFAMAVSALATLGAVIASADKDPTTKELK